MARNFVSNDIIKATLTNQDAGPTGNYSVIAAIKTSAQSLRKILVARSASAAERSDFGISGGNFRFWSGTACSAIAVTNGVWLIAAVSKASGTATPRFHVLNLDTSGYTHADGDFSLASALNHNLGDISWQFCNNNAQTESLNGDCGWIAVFNKTVSDGEFEAFTSLNDISSFGPSRLWVFDQANVTDTVQELMGTGEHETSRTGTTVVTGPPSPWDVLTVPSAAIFIPANRRGS